MKAAAVILAAGKQTRFGEGLPKSLHKVGDQTILERLSSLLPYPRIVVVNEDWTKENRIQAIDYGNSVIKIKSRNIGESIASGLDVFEDCDSVYVVSADTFCLDKFPLPSKGFDCLFDPDKRITVWRLNKKNQNTLRYIRSEVNDRVVVTALLGFRTRLINWNWWMNINTQEDLEKARELYDSSK